MLFIRLDAKGTWKGTNHRSSIAGSAIVDTDEEIKWEKGISCYSLENIVDALEQLHHYWFKLASISEDDLKNMQVTIFEGERLGYGADMEILANCTKTIKQFDALDFMLMLDSHIDDYEFEDITKEEYTSILEQLYTKEA